MSGYALFGGDLELATGLTELALQWFVQSTLVIAAGLTVAAFLRKRTPALRSVVYHTTLLTALACPLAAYLLSTAGLTFIAIELPSATYERVEVVRVPAPPVEPAPPSVAPPSQAATEIAADEKQSERPQQALADPLLTGPDGLNFASSSPAPPNGLSSESASPQPIVEDPPAPLRPPAPAAAMVRRIVETRPLVAAVFLSIPIVWGLATLVLLGRLALDHLRLARLRRTAAPVDELSERVCLDVARRLGVSAPRMLRTPLVTSPCLSGVFFPTVLLPEEISEASLSAVMVHELAHLKRGDCFWNLLRHLGTSLLWPQPLMWRLSHRMEAAAEDVCDDYVLEFGESRTAYAETLLTIAERNLLPASGAAVSLVTFRSMLGQRVQRILDHSRRLTLTVGLAALMLVAVGGVSAGLVAGLLGPRSNEAVAVAPRDSARDEKDEKKADDTLPHERDDNDQDNLDEPERDQKSVPANDASTAESPAPASPDDDLVTVRGTVLDPQGQPRNGARVMAIGWDGLLVETRSDQEGEFSVQFSKAAAAGESPDGWRVTRLLATADGLAPGIVSCRDLNAGGEAMIKLETDAAIEGRIVDLEGNPVAGATLGVRSLSRSRTGDLLPWLESLRSGTVYSKDHANKPDLAVYKLANDLFADATTDADGRFRIAGLGPQSFVSLKLQGGGIVTTNLDVVTLPTEPIVARFGNPEPYFERDVTLFGAKFQYAAEPSQPVAGTVTDSATGKPLAGVRVLAIQFAGKRLDEHEPATVETDSQGTYRLEGMPRGRGNKLLVLPAVGQPYFAREVEVSVGDGLAAARVDVGLHQGVLIRGSITNKASRRPVDTIVKYVPWPNNPALGADKFEPLHRTEAHRRTDDEGRFEVVGLPGTGLLMLECRGEPLPTGQGLEVLGELSGEAFRDLSSGNPPSESYPTAVHKVDIPADAADIAADVALDAGERVTLEIVDAAGQPISGLNVKGTGPISNPRYQSDVSSRFDVQALKSNEKRWVVIEHPERKLGRAIQVSPADGQPLGVELQPYAKLTARLLDDNGDPIRDGYVGISIEVRDNWAFGIADVRSDSDGRLQFDSLPPGASYDIVMAAVQTNWQPLAKKLTANPGETIDLGEFDVTSDARPEPKRTLQTANAEAATPPAPADDDLVTVRGTVLDPDGKPLAGARVRAIGYQRMIGDASFRTPRPPLSETRSGANGSYEISFRKSQCELGIDRDEHWQFTTIAATQPGFGPSFRDYVDIKDPQSATLQLVVDEPIRGQILNLEGQPVAGATLQLRGVGRNEKEDLSRWIAAMREGASYSNSASLDRPAYASPETRFIHPEPIQTDAEGRFTLAGIGRNRYAILRLIAPGTALTDLYVVTAPVEPFAVEMGSAHFEHPITYYGSNFQFAAGPSQPLEGVVRDSITKQPLAGARVILDKLAGTMLSGVFATETLSDAEGRYRLEGMPRGEGNGLLVIPRDDQPYFMREFDKVPVGQDFAPINLDLDLQRGIWITGRVTNQKTGAPLHARMYYLPWPNNPHIVDREQFQDNHLHGPQTSYLTDSDGRYRVVGLPGRGLVAAWCVHAPFPQGQGVKEIPDLPTRDEFHTVVGSFAPTEQFPTIVKEIRPADTATDVEVDVEVRAGASLKVRFVDRAGQPLSQVSVQGLWPKAVGRGSADDKLAVEAEVLGLRADERRLLIVHQPDRQLGKVLDVGLADARDGPLSITLEPCITVTGRLLDDSGDPLHTARIRAQPSTERDYALELPWMTTDDNGKFTITLLPGCAYDLGCDAPQVNGLKSIARELAVSPGETIDLGEFDVTTKERPEPKRTLANAATVAAAPTATAAATPTLPPTPATSAPLILRGVVLDPQGKPAAGVSLRAFAIETSELSRDSADAWKEKSPPNLTTDAAGKFSIDLGKTTADYAAWPGEFPLALVVATAPGTGPAWIVINQSNVDQDNTLRLVADQSVTARIVNLEGQPIAGVTVEVESIESNADGDLTEWLAALRGGMSYRAAEKLRGERRNQLGFVSRWGLSNHRFVDIRGTTDADGRVKLSGIGHGRLANLKISGPGIVTTRSKAVALPMEPIDVDLTGLSLPAQQRYYGADFTLSLENSSPIEGVVRDADSQQPLAGARVVSNKFAGTNHIQNYLVSTVSGADGHYRLDGMPSGKGGNILAIPPDDQPYFLRGFDVPTGQPLEVVKLDLELHRGVWIEGRVRDAETKEPILGQLFYLPWPDHPKLNDLPELTRRALPGPPDHYHTDPQGRYRIVGLPGRGLVEFYRQMNLASARSYPAGQGIDQIADLPSDEAFSRISQLYAPRSPFITAVREVNAADEGTTTADLELREGDRIALRLLDPAGQPLTGARVRGLSPPGQFYKYDDLGPTVEVAGLSPGETRRVFVEHPQRRLGKGIELSVAEHGKGPLDIRVEPYATVTGKLNLDGDPLKGQVVHLSYLIGENYVDQQESEVNDAGQFVFDEIPAGVKATIFCDLKAPRRGPRNIVKNLSVSGGETVDLGEIDLAKEERPEPKRTPAKGTVGAAQNALPDSPEAMVVRGMVLDTAGKPAVKAAVMLMRSHNSSKWAKDVPPPTTETETDASGRFELQVPKVLSDGWRSGQPWPLFAVTVKAQGSATTHLKLETVADIRDVVVRLTPFVPLEGRIVNLEGRPIPGVSVRLHQVEAKYCGNIEPWLEALQKGTPPSEVDEAIKSGIGWGDDEMRAANMAITDADGRFRLNQVGRHYIALLKLSGGGIVSTTIEVANAPTAPISLGDHSRKGDSPTLYGSPFEYAAEPAPPIIGVIKDAETDKPVAGVKISSRQYESINQAGFGLLEAVSDEQGRYRLDGMPRGKSDRIVVRGTGDVPYLVREFEVPEGRGLEPIEFDISLHRGVWIEGRVTDAKEGKPVAAKVVYLPWFDNRRIERLPEYQGNGLMGVDPTVAPNTDAEGRFKVIGIPGRGLLQVTHTAEPKFPVGQGFDKVPDLIRDAEKFRQLAQLNMPKPEYTVAVQELNIADDAERVEADFALLQGETVALSVVDPDGIPIDVTQATGLVSGHWVQTHREFGKQIEVAGVVAGETRIVLLMNLERRLGAMIEVRLSDGGTQRRQVTLRPLATITGRLVDDAGEPLPRPTPRENVHLQTTVNGQFLRPYDSSTDNTGGFELLAVPGPLDYNVFAEGVTGMLVENLRVEPGESIDLRTIDSVSRKRPPIKRTPAKLSDTTTRAASAAATPETFQFTGKVLDPAGKPKVASQVALLYYNGKQPVLSPPATTSDDGGFLLRVPRDEIAPDDANSATLIVTSPGQAPVWDRAASFDSSGALLKMLESHYRYDELVERSKDRTLRLVADDVPISGRIINLEGQPVAGARIRVRTIYANPTGSLDAWLKGAESGEFNLDQLWKHVPESISGRISGEAIGHLLPEVVADADGRFKLTGIGRDRLVELLVSADGLETRPIHVRTRPGDALQIPEDVTDPDAGSETCYGPSFEYALAPSRPIAGVVRDVDTDKPLEGIQVVPEVLAGTRLHSTIAYDHLKTTTDAEGRYRLLGLPIGTNQIAALAPREEPYAVAALEVEIDPAKESTTLDFRLKRGVWIRGRVTDAQSGQTLRGGVEYLSFSSNPNRRASPGLLAAMPPHGWIDKDGRYQVVGLPGPGLISLLANDGSGTDKYPRGAGAESIEGTDEGLRKMFRTSPYLLAAVNTHYVAKIDPAPETEFIEHDIQLHAGKTIAGRVLDPEGRPLAGANCSGLANAGYWSELKTAEFEVRHLRDGEKRRLYFHHAERDLAGSIEVSADEKSPLAVQLVPSGTIKGRLLLEDGDPADRVSLWQTHEGREPRGVLPGRQAHLTDGDGRFQISGLIPGLYYSVRASRGSNSLGTAIENVTIAAGETKDLGDLTIAAPEN